VGAEAGVAGGWYPVKFSSRRYSQWTSRELEERCEGFCNAGRSEALLLNLQPKIWRVGFSTKLSLNGLRRLVENFAVRAGSGEVLMYSEWAHTRGQANASARDRGSWGLLDHLFALVQDH